MILHRRGSVSTVVAHDTPPSWLGIHRRGSWYSTVVARYPPSWLMILHRRGSVSTVVAHDTPPSWLGIHRRGSWYPTIVAHDTPPSWLMILHRRGSVSTVVAHDTPPSWLGIHRRGSVHFIQGAKCCLHHVPFTERSNTTNKLVLLLYDPPWWACLMSAWCLLDDVANADQKCWPRMLTLRERPLVKCFQDTVIFSVSRGSPRTTNDRPRSLLHNLWSCVYVLL